MTLVLSVHGRDTLWTVTDRRLSYGDRCPPKDDAVKVVSLDTTDGLGILAYAGLGATSRRTQPSEWMSAVLRGRGGLTLEQALGVLSEAARKELPPHLRKIEQVDARAHFILVPAFVDKVGPKLYSVDNAIDDEGKHWYRYTRHDRSIHTKSYIRVGLAGSGGVYLYERRNSWERALLDLVNKNDRGRASDEAVAIRLASLNYQAHQGESETVGPRSIVLWRRRPGAPGARSGGGHQFYIGTEHDPETAAVPTISNGLDVQSVVGVLVPHLLRHVENQEGNEGAPLDIDRDDINRLLSRLPGRPDERLR